MNQYEIELRDKVALLALEEAIKDTITLDNYQLEMSVITGSFAVAHAFMAEREKRDKEPKE